MSLMIASVFCESPMFKFWYDTQLNFIRETTTDFEHCVFLNRIHDHLVDSSIIGVSDSAKPKTILQMSKEHSHSLSRLIEHFLTSKHEYCLILDSDCFPIKTGWMNHLIEKMKPFNIASVIRFENLTPQPHPCAMFFHKDGVGKLDLSVSGSFDLIGRSTMDICHGMKVKGSYPLIRTNRVNIHPVWAAIYADIFYHHGCGSRKATCWSDSYHGWGVSSNELFDEFMRNQKYFISKLMNRTLMG